MKKYFSQLKMEIDSLTVFSKLKEDPAISCLRLLLDTIEDKDTNTSIDLYSRFVSALYKNTASLTDYIKTLVLQDDNFYVKGHAEKKHIDHVIRDSVDHELSILQKIASLTSDSFQDIIGYEGFLPEWTTRPIDIQYDFMEKLSNISVTGYGIYAKYCFFRLKEGNVVPVVHPDYQPLNQLFGYERERNIIIKNTKALIDGKGASNMLLYGDAGTGKSSTVKAEIGRASCRERVSSPV